MIITMIHVLYNCQPFGEEKNTSNTISHVWFYDVLSKDAVLYQT